MPQRPATMAPSSGHASPGPQVLPKPTDRPIPARRRSAQQLSGHEVDNSMSPNELHHGNSNNNYYSRQDSNTEIPNLSDVERRRQMLTSPSFTSAYPPSRPVSTVRPQSALAMTSPPAHHVERPPSSLGVAWGSSQKYGVNRQNMIDQRAPFNDNQNPNSVEARLKSLVGDTRVNNSRWSGQGGQQKQSYQDGELILPVHQRSHSHNEALGQGYNNGGNDMGLDRPEDVYAVVNRSTDVNRSHQLLPGYVNSQTVEQNQGQRQDGYQSQGQRYQPSHNAVSHNASGPTDRSTGRAISRGQENPGFLPDDQSRGVIGPNKGATSHDLRSAWQRLYGNRPDPTANRRPSTEDMARAQTPQHHIRHQSPSLSHQNHHPRPNPAMNETLESAGSFHNISQGSTQQLSQPSPGGHHMLLGRESPTGQSSSNPEQVSNTSSQLSSYSVTNTSAPQSSQQQRNISTFKPTKNDIMRAYGNSAPAALDPTIGPAAKYPEIQTTRRSPAIGQAGHVHFQKRSFHEGGPAPRAVISRNQNKGSMSPGRSRIDSISPENRIDSISPETVEFNVSDSPPLRPMSRRKTHALFDSGDEMDGADYPALGANDSIFDYAEADSENGSVTPPLPPLSPSATPRGSGQATPTNMSPRYTHGSREHLQRSPPKTPDLLRANASNPVSRSRVSKKDSRTSRFPSPKGHEHGIGKDRLNKGDFGDLDTLTGPYVRSRSLDDVRESENESTLSFDVENTMLTVEPSDQSEMGTLRSSHKSTGSVRAQLNRLEGMYSHVMKTLEENSQAPRTTRRRWSIGSSDTSSFHQHSHSGKHGNHGRGSSHKMSSRDVRSIGKRFQRLESHVITLARSVAHLSSELRTHTSVSREIEIVKREMAELKSQNQGSTYPLAAPRNIMGGNIMMTDFERYRGWVPSLTNPRRVNKLTKFFGQEPPLLEIFLKRLGYERFAKNFEDEHIGMIELPYMTEERLQAIGIPMGPRLRILQEAQLCFKQGNFDVYFV